MKSPSFALLLCLAAGTPGCQQVPQPVEVATSQQQLRGRAAKLAHELIILDTHIDLPFRLAEKMEDISQRTEEGDFDYPRAREGGLDAAFVSIYIPARYQNGGARQLADKLILMVEGLASRWPEKFALAQSVQDIYTHFAQGKISLPMGMENGAPIEGKLENLQYYYQQGIRYITLTHSRNNHICDSSYDRQPRWNGLSPFGKEVVAEMNRLGIMIDVSHVSDDAFRQVMELSKAPVIASHSSSRHFTPGWERNMSDEMLLQLKENGGVIQINFGSSFLSDEYRKKQEERRKRIAEYLRVHNLEERDEAAQKYIEAYDQENPIQHAHLSHVVEHIDHVVQLIGVDHIGFGSDFDGVGDSLPEGLKDVAGYPNLIYELLKGGYSEKDIQKISAGNLLRVWSKVEKVARQLQEAQ